MPSQLRTFGVSPIAPARFLPHRVPVSSLPGHGRECTAAPPRERLARVELVGVVVEGDGPVVEPQSVGAVVEGWQWTAGE